MAKMGRKHTTPQGMKDTTRKESGGQCRDVGSVSMTPSMTGPATKVKTGPTMTEVPVTFDDAD